MIRNGRTYDSDLGYNLGYKLRFRPLYDGEPLLPPPDQITKNIADTWAEYTDVSFRSYPIDSA